MSEPQSLPKPALVLIALVQGLLLLLLHELLEAKQWPYGSPPWLYACFTVIVAAPTMLLLALTGGNAKRLFGLVLPFAVLIGALGYYMGSQETPVEWLRSGTMAFVYWLTMAIICFKALMYIQQYADGGGLVYGRLLQLSWRNFLILGLSLAFVAGFWGILVLWGSLFKIIKITFFHDLFTNEWFLYPALGLAHGFGVVIFRNQAGIIDTIIRLNQALMKFLLLILVFVAIIFLCALPFTGLAPLWETKTGSGLILWMQALILFFLNAVYQDDSAIDPGNGPYHRTLHRFVYFGIALLPIYSVIGFYGLQLRVAQYGWTIERCWAVLLWALLALFALGYLWGIAKSRDRWTTHLGAVNVRLGLVVLAALLLTNSPLLDFRKISVASQMARLNSGELTLDNFDYAYFSRYLERPGFDALQTIKRDRAQDRPDIVAKIDELYRNKWAGRPAEDRAGFAAKLKVWPVGDPLPPSVVDAIFAWSQHRAAFQEQQSYVFHIDLNADGVAEYIALNADGPHFNVALLLQLSGEEWQQINVRLTGSMSEADLAASIARGDVKIVAPQWSDLRIGELLLQVESQAPAQPVVSPQ